MTGFIGTDNQGNSTTGQPSEGTTGTQGAAGRHYPINDQSGNTWPRRTTRSRSSTDSCRLTRQRLTVTADNKTIAAYRQWFADVHGQLQRLCE